MWRWQLDGLSDELTVVAWGRAWLRPVVGPARDLPAARVRRLPGLLHRCAGLGATSCARAGALPPEPGTATVLGAGLRLCRLSGLASRRGGQGASRQSCARGGYGPSIPTQAGAQERPRRPHAQPRCLVWWRAPEPAHQTCSIATRARRRPRILAGPGPPSIPDAPALRPACRGLGRPPTNQGTVPPPRRPRRSGALPQRSMRTAHTRSSTARIVTGSR